MSATSGDRETLKDISHTPPTGDSVAAVWERGHAADD